MISCKGRSRIEKLLFLCKMLIYLCDRRTVPMHWTLLLFYDVLVLARTTTESIHVFREREGDELECLGHRRIRMDQIDEVVRCGPEAQGHRCFVDHLPGI